MPSVQTLPDFILKIKNEILKCNPRTLIIACKSLSDSIFIDWIISLKQINYIEVYTIIPSSGTTNNNLTGVKKLLFFGAKVYIVDNLYQDVLIINSNKLILGNLSSLLDYNKQQNKYYYSVSEYSWLYKADLHTFLGIKSYEEYDPYKRKKRMIDESSKNEPKEKETSKESSSTEQISDDYPIDEATSFIPQNYFNNSAFWKPIEIEDKIDDNKKEFESIDLDRDDIYLLLNEKINTLLSNYMDIYGKVECVSLMEKLSSSKSFNHNLNVAFNKGNVPNATFIKQMIYTAYPLIFLKAKRKMYFSLLFFLGNLCAKHQAYDKSMDLLQLNKTLLEILEDYNGKV